MILFKKYKNNPIITPDYNNSFEKECTYNPCVIVHNKKIFMIYRAEDKYGRYVSRLCLAVSNNGFNFKKYENNPIISPTKKEERRGCEDPRITKINDTFYLTYVSWDGNLPLMNDICLATSKNLINWKKQGIMINGFKAGALYPEKVKGKYIMFVKGSGQGRKATLNTYIAKSKDLKEWKIDKKPILKPRKNFFDNFLIEPGPAPFMVKDKLVLIFNTADKNIIYRPSLAILNKDNPKKLIYRSKEPLLSPSEQFELYGKIDNVIFTDGIFEFRNKYFLYYGGADKCTGVATVKKKEFEKYIDSLC